MEYSERVLCGTGEVELDPNIVSEEAGKLYSELQVRHLIDLFLFSIPLLFPRKKKKFFWGKSLFDCGCTHLVSHSGALCYHRQLLRPMAKVWLNPWYLYLCGSWRGWPAAKPSWETGRRRRKGRKLSEKSCWRDTKQKKHWGKIVKRWGLIEVLMLCDLTVLRAAKSFCFGVF